MEPNNPNSKDKFYAIQEVYLQAISETNDLLQAKILMTLALKDLVTHVESLEKQIQILRHNPL